jgi:hypothetical protein
MIFDPELCMEQIRIRSASEEGRMQRLWSSCLILASVLAGGCFGPIVTGSGKVVTETRNVSGFSAVSLEGSGRLVIEQTGTESLTITGDDNLLPYIESSVSGKTLTLGEKDGTSISPSKDIVFKLTVKSLNNIDISGSGTADAKGLQAQALKVDISGSGEVSADGAADELNLGISGSGRYRGNTLRSKRARVDISGSGSAVLAVSEKLDANVSGSGSIEYIGDPQIQQDISGSGSVRKR